MMSLYQDDVWQFFKFWYGFRMYISEQATSKSLRLSTRSVTGGQHEQESRVILLDLR